MTFANLTISLLGEFSLTMSGKPLPPLAGERPISLLAYLLLHRHTPQSRQQIAFMLWPDSTDGQARTNLRNLFFTLRQTLPEADRYLAADAMTLQWQTEAPYTLDVADFEAGLAAAAATPAVADKITHLETAVSLYKGDLLPTNYDDWIIPLRETLRQHYQEALHQLVALLEQQQDFRTAVRYGQRLLQLDPLDEAAYLQLMQLHAYGGERAGVRRVYEQCVAMLQQELDIEPSPATERRYRELLRLEASPAPAAPPPAVAAPLSPRPLPNPLTPFVGREAELAQLSDLLSDPASRLITIVGHGGMGKTRLALETAASQQPCSTASVAWVSLAPLQNGNQLIAAIADALRYRLTGTADSLSELISFINSRPLLLVLDNFEHLLATTPLIVELLTGTTAVKLLVTSRQALNLQQEWRYELQSLPLPDPHLPQLLPTNSAIMLFEQSARRVVGTLQLTADDYEQIARICRLVEGVPLGIELAASWLRLLSCAEIAAEIEQSFDFLTVSAKDVPTRHHSLRAVFDSSWSLLAPAEQQTLLRLAVFQGSFTREAAATIAEATLTQLSTLVDCSLLQKTTPSISSGQAVGRYALHEMVRQYTVDRLRADEASWETAVQRHSDYYLNWLAAQDPLLRSKKQKEALLAIVPEMGNIRAAWQQAVRQCTLPLLRGASFALFYFFELRGLVHSGELIFRQAADALETTLNDAEREMQVTYGDFRTNQGYFTMRLGQQHAAEAILLEALYRLVQVQDSDILPFTYRYLGLVAGMKREFEQAHAYFTQSLALFLPQQRRWETAVTEAYFGLVAIHQGEMDKAQAHLETALAESRRLGDQRLRAYSLLLVGLTYFTQNLWTAAQRAFEESMVISQETDDTYVISMARLYLGLIKHEQGDLLAARRLIQMSMHAFEQISDKVSLRRAQLFLAFLDLDEGQYTQAAAVFRKQLRQEERELGKHFSLGALIGLATLEAISDNAATAMLWILVVLQQPAVDPLRRDRALRLRTKLEAMLEPEAIAALKAQAAHQTLDGIISELVAAWAEDKPEEQGERPFLSLALA